MVGLSHDRYGELLSSHRNAFVAQSSDLEYGYHQSRDSQGCRSGKVSERVFTIQDAETESKKYDGRVGYSSWTNQKGMYDEKSSNEIERWYGVLQSLLQEVVLIHCVWISGLHSYGRFCMLRKSYGN